MQLQSWPSVTINYISIKTKWDSSFEGIVLSRVFHIILRCWYTIKGMRWWWYEDKAPIIKNSRYTRKWFLAFMETIIDWSTNIWKDYYNCFLIMQACKSCCFLLRFFKEWANKELTPGNHSFVITKLYFLPMLFQMIAYSHKWNVASVFLKKQFYK